MTRNSHSPAEPQEVLAAWWLAWMQSAQRAQQGQGRVAGLALGLSGGPDSVALAAALAPMAQAAQVPLQFWHVHHGLSDLADTWQRTCEQLASHLHVPIRVRRVVVAARSQRAHGIEAAARHARYEALQQLAQEEHISHLVLAQHADDQVETVFIRLLRGGGPGALAGMRSPSSQGGLTLWRPWLEVPRAAILALAHEVAERFDIALADDPTNLDPQYARGQLRRVVLPSIAEHWPGYRSVVLRHARQAAEIDDVLQEVVQADFEAVAGPELATLRLTPWLALSSARSRLVLREWLKRLGGEPSSAAKLAELERQLRQARADRQLRWQHNGWQVARYRELILARRLPAAGGDRPEEPWRRVWQGEPFWVLPHGGGELHFEQAEQGCDPQWLLGRELELGWRLQGGRMRLQADGPTRTLKRCFQEAGIPAWERERCLRVRVDGELLFVHRLGNSLRLPQAGPGLRLRWEPADSSVQSASATMRDTPS